MNIPILASISKFGVIFCLSCSAGLYAFFSPQNIEGASSSAIAALSIIFGLSTAVLTLLKPQEDKTTGLSNDPFQRAKQIEIIQRDDARTLSRQKTLHQITLASVIFGLIYLVALKDSPNSLITKTIAFSFSFSATFSLLSTMFLPNLLASLVERNSHIQGRKK